VSKSLGRRAAYRKGIRLIFLNHDEESSFLPRKEGGGNANELGDVGRSPGKSYLFFLTGYHPGNRLPGDRVQCLV
jgi:hypothetical protein